MKTVVTKTAADGTTEVIECPDTPSETHGPVTLPIPKMTAFTMFEHFINANSCVRIDGVLHIYNHSDQCYQPFNKQEVESLLLRNYYRCIAATGSLRIVKTCANLIIHGNYPEVSPAEKNGYLCFKDGYLTLSDVNKAIFYSYDLQNNNIFPTFHLDCSSSALFSPLAGSKSLSTPHMDHFLRTSAFGIPYFADRVWEMLGYLLSPDNDGKCFFVLQGFPNSGKSILGRFIQKLYPQYRIANLDIDQLNKEKSTKKLINKSINISMDLPNKPLGPLAIRNIKLITGNDTITIEHKTGEYESFEVNCKFLFATNHSLTLCGADSGLEERLVCIPFTRSIPSEQRDHNLLDELLEEKEHIVAKAIAYYRSLRNRNYVFSGSGNALFNPRVRYLPTAADDLNANLCDFIEDRCIFIPIEEKRGIHTDVFYKAYREYCADYNETPISNEKAFSRKVLELYAPHVKKEKWRKPGAANPTAGFYGIAFTPMQQIYNV